MCLSFVAFENITTSWPRLLVVRVHPIRVCCMITDVGKNLLATVMKLPLFAFSVKSRFTQIVSKRHLVTLKYNLSCWSMEH